MVHSPTDVIEGAVSGQLEIIELGEPNPALVVTENDYELYCKFVTNTLVPHSSHDDTKVIPFVPSTPVISILVPSAGDIQVPLETVPYE